MYCNKPNPTEDDRQKILNLQPKLDEIYSRKAQGAFIRSRAKWIEEGGKNSLYFCGLEKSRQGKNSIRSLLIDNNEVTDEKVISSEIWKFYSQLYSSKFSSIDCQTFFQDIAKHIPKIEDALKQTCAKSNNNYRT